MEERTFSMRPSIDNLGLTPHKHTDYNKIRVGLKQLEDAIIDSPSARLNPILGRREKVMEALTRNDLQRLREISDFWYKTSGIYGRLCRYMAQLFRYDWYVIPFVEGGDTYPIDDDKKDIDSKRLNQILDDFFKCLRYLDNFDVKRFCMNVALKVVRFGCYYGYICESGSRVGVQELPIEYCRSRYSVDNSPVIEFNMKYFDDTYPDEEYRKRVLKLFPKEFRNGYRAYREGRLPGDYAGDTAGWYMLTPGLGVKFNINDDDTPIFVTVIPYIIDLLDAQGLDKKKMAQNLVKIIIQKLPLDKNGDILFDPDEAQQLHLNAVQMLQRAIGVDVLTTFADVDVADMADGTTVTSIDDLSKVERALFNEAGVPEMLFNTDGNIALEKSILKDCAVMTDLLLQFQSFLNLLLRRFNTEPERVYYEAQILSTTQYNYKELSKLYEGQVKLGYSKLLPQIALGQSQSSILASAYFENDLLNLVTVFVPPLSSNTMNADALEQQQTGRGVRGNKAITQTGNDSDAAGRPELPDDQKSEKTLQNIEAQS